MSGSLYLLLAILVTAAVTLLTRAAPFLLFRKRELPKTVRWLGGSLPQAIMVILVCYCLRSVDFSAAPFGLAELGAAALVVLLQATKKNMYVSILAGTAAYMLLIRIL